MSWVVGMFMVHAKKRSDVIVGEEDVVSGNRCVVSSCAGLCIIWRMWITVVRGCVGCCIMVLLMVV